MDVGGRQLLPEVDGIEAAEAAAVGRYRETVQLANERLQNVQQGTDSADETVAKLSWTACMPLSTSEEAPGAKQRLMKVRLQGLQDTIARTEKAAKLATEGRRR